MTPYAVLLVKPTDSDEVIRRVYHDVARLEHPDVVEGGEPSEAWYTAATAYTLIKTEDARQAWATRQASLSGLCGQCNGCGVQGTRMFKGKIRVCDTCKGEGRV